MSKRMLIDATHAEETRVAVMGGNRLEDYDVEIAAKKQLKGNIYLARVVRVEPSLQAAFVDYGGNRHGFLAFSEIHPDYYQIPVADREQLLALQAEEEALLEAAEREENEEPPEARSETDDDTAASVAEDDSPAFEGGDEVPEARTRSRNDAPDYVGGETDTGDEALIQKRIARFLRNYRIQEVIHRRQVILVQVVKEERGNKGAALTTYISLAGRYCVLMPNALRGGGVSRKITSVPDRRRLRDIISDLELPRGMAMIVRTAGAQRPGPEITRDCEYLLHLWDDIRDHTLQSLAPTLIYEEASLVKRAIRDGYTREISEILVDGEAGWKAARDFMRLLMPQHADKIRLWNRNNQSLFTHYHVEGHLDAIFSPTVSLRSGGYLVINQTEALVAIDINSGKATNQRNIEETAFRTNQEAADEIARQLRLRDLAGLIVIDFIDMESRRHNVMIERRMKDALRNDRARIQMGNISHFGLMELSRQRLRPSVAEAVFAPCPHCHGTGMIRSIESSALHVLRAIEEEVNRRRASALTVYVDGNIALYILNNKRSWVAETEKRHGVRILFAADNTLPAPEIRIERQQASGREERFSSPVTTPADAPLAAETAPAAQIVATETPAETSEQNISATAPAAGEEEPRRRRRRRRRGGNREDRAQQHNDQNQSDAPQPVQSESSDTPEPSDEQPDVAQTEHALMPGRRRTRHSRVRRPEQQQAKQSEQNDNKAVRHVPIWRGPTPANPFGDEVEMFDLTDEDPTEETSDYQEPVIRAVATATVSKDNITSPESAEKETGDQPQKSRNSRRRRSGRAKQTEAEATETGEVVTQDDSAAPVQADEPAVATEDKPKTRRKPARKKEPEVVAEDSGEAVQEKKPARRRRTSKKAEAAERESSAPEKASTDNDADPSVVQPVVISDEAPKGRPRTGWWRR
ncbi:Rne/Rng family ribonuclease [Acetobacter thailandicus]|uniref:Rne/Rng family ribonuclease n=1 Tax=Acetobacter thailandicus TaxID=1502842 RepID=UPI001BA703A3|nr:ribonuclease E/G [Acetobacter thailandicus]MBS0985958.1 Rne/Rng family ribonuclease [Acetobacter thailandicus]